jgi:O-antigen/teichoic acid export membrane protein
VVLNLLVGSKYIAAGTVLQILTVYIVVSTLGMGLKILLGGIGKPMLGLTVILVEYAIYLPLCLLLIPLFGATGIALAMFFPALVAFYVAIFFAKRYIKFAAQIPSLLKAVIGGGIVFLMIGGLKLIIDLPPVVEAVVIMAPGLFFYSLWILRTKALDWNDLLLIRNTIPIPKYVLNLMKKFIPSESHHP